MKMNEKFYEAPDVEVVEVVIEQGFGISTTETPEERAKDMTIFDE